MAAMSSTGICTVMASFFGALASMMVTGRYATECSSSNSQWTESV